MNTINNIKSYIEGLNPQSSTMSSLGSFISEQSRNTADFVRRELIQIVSKESLAYKILISADHSSEKQLWVIAYELVKNENFVIRINAIHEKEAQKIAASKAKLADNKDASKEVLSFVKESGLKLGDYYKFVKTCKKYAKEFYSKKFSMDSAKEFVESNKK